MWLSEEVTLNSLLHFYKIVTLTVEKLGFLETALVDLSETYYTNSTR